MAERPLDLDLVRAFVRIAEAGSFTRAAEGLGTNQAAVSSKLKRLEQRLDRRLIERTPRYVRLSAHGDAFLDIARALLDAHDRALTVFHTSRQRLTIGMSDHVAGHELSALIARMNANDPRLLIEIRIGSSEELLQSYDRREIDAVIVRLHAGRSDAQLLAQEQFGWFAVPGWQLRAGQPLPVVTMAEPSGGRTLAATLLDSARIPWAETFIGGGIATVVAAVMAGLGVAALAPRMLPFGAVEVGGKLGLPKLPCLPIFLHSRASSGLPHDALLALAAAFRSCVASCKLNQR